MGDGVVEEDPLALERQVCFALATASRSVTACGLDAVTAVTHSEIHAGA